MKKVFAILLSLVLVVSAVFAISMFTAAEEASEVYANTVEIHLEDGTVVYLGAQPILETKTEGEGESATTTTSITGYDATKIVPILNLDQGSFAFDHTTGTLTMTDVEGVAAVKCYTGSLVVVVKGTNTLVNKGSNSVIVNFTEYEDPNAETKVVKRVGNLTIKGDGTLNATSSAYGFVSQSGNLEITDNVTINVATTGSGNADAIHTATNVADNTKVIFSGNAKVTASSVGNYTVRAQGANGGVYIKDDVQITLNTTVTAGWKGGIRAGNFEQSGGTVNVNVVNEESKKANEILGLDIQGGKATFSGGTLNVDVQNKYGARGYGLFFKNLSDVVFSGTIVDLKVTNSKSATNNAIVTTQGTTPKLTISGGKISYSGDANTTGFLGMNSANIAIAISGCTITGTAKSFVYSQGVDMTLNITGGAFDTTATTSNFTYSNTSKKITQSGSVTVDAAGTTFKSGTVGTVAPVKGTCSVASNAVLTPKTVTADANASVTAIVKAADGAYAEVKTDAKYVSTTHVLTIAGNALTRAIKEFDTVPAAPVVKITGLKDTTATVSWEPAEGATSYEVYFEGEKVATVTTETSYVLKDLTAETSYKVAVVGLNNVGASEKTEATFKTLKKGVCGEVTVIMADGTSVLISADNPTANGATGTIVFDLEKATVTLTDVTGVQAVVADKAVDLTYVIKGTNTLETASQSNQVRAYNLVIEGDGVLNLKNTMEGCYPVLGQKSITVQGDVTFNVDVVTKGTAIHAARGIDPDDGVCFIKIADNAKVDLKNANGYGLHAAGHSASVIITGKAKVSIDSTNNAIFAKADTLRANNTDAPAAYVEVSGSANLLVTKGNCGIRSSYGINGTVAGTATIVFKGNSVSDITAPGQVIYAVDDTGSNNTATNTATVEIADNASVKATNKGPASNGNYYAALHLNSDKNYLKISGGSMELYSPELNAYKLNGSTTPEIAEGFKSFVAGADAETAKDATRMSTSVKYIKLVYDYNPNTSANDLTVPVTVLALSVVACAAVIVLRKKAYKA